MTPLRRGLDEVGCTRGRVSVMAYPEYSLKARGGLVLQRHLAHKKPP
eukprot:CAMPEP_0180301944 /NCGR_PEP_ID=MMETSP0988-20121125/23876_1 /TAXON_ID=697907 /ORGANISM="non described non described, Strain CCMP2293" /LENGTH=46 /DNA_ID= /DNA_START= /DNA_END= /DNA_ORIENTATION=